MGYMLIVLQILSDCKFRAMWVEIVITSRRRTLLKQVPYLFTLYCTLIQSDCCETR